MALFIDSTEILPTYDIVLGGVHLKQIDVVEGSNPPVTVWRKNAWIVHIPEGLTKTLKLYKNGVLLETVTTAGDYVYETADNDSLSIKVNDASCWSGTATSGAVEITASYEAVTWSLTAPTTGEFYRIDGNVFINITANGRSTKALPYSYNYVIDAEKELTSMMIHTGGYISGSFGSTIPESNTYRTLGTVIYDSASPVTGFTYDNSHFTSVTIPHMGVYSGFGHSTYTKTDDQYIKFN